MTAAAPAVLDQWRLFDAVGFHPHPGQAKILASQARFNVSVCGRRFGKSELGGHKLLAEAFLTLPMRDMLKEERRRREFWIVGPEYTDSEKEHRVLYNELSKLQVPFDKPGTYNNPQTGDMHISLWDGTFQVHAKSAKHPETLVGEGLSGVVMAEAAKIRERVWQRYVRATLDDYEGWADFTTTPEGKNWIYGLWQQGQDPRYPAWSSFRMPSWSNPFVYPGGGTDKALARLRAALKGGAVYTKELAAEFDVDYKIGQSLQDLTEPAFNQEYGADFTEFVGRVFQDFDEETHVSDLVYQPGWSTYGAVDYGNVNPNVWLLVQVDPHGELVNVLGEVWQRDLAPDQFANLILERRLKPDDLREFYPDPASPGDTSILERTLGARGMPHTGGKITERLDLIRRWLRWNLPEGTLGARPRLMFDRSCVESIREFNDYRYRDSQGGTPQNPSENPMKLDDHAPEALGRFFAGRFGAQALGARAARSVRATVSRGRSAW